MNAQPQPEPLDVVAAWAAYQRAAAALAWLEAETGAGAATLFPSHLAAAAAIVAAQAAALAHALSTAAAGSLSADIGADETRAQGGTADRESGGDDSAAAAAERATRYTVKLAGWHMATAGAADVASAARESAGALFDVAGFEDEYPLGLPLALAAFVLSATLPTAIGRAAGQWQGGESAPAAELLKRLRWAADTLERQTDGSEGAP